MFASCVWENPPPPGVDVEGVGRPTSSGEGEPELGVDGEGERASGGEFILVAYVFVRWALLGVSCMYPASTPHLNPFGCEIRVIEDKGRGVFGQTPIG